MNWERVHFIYYVYTSITVIFLLLGLGKFFCVGKLYEVYDKLNESMDNTLGCVITIGTIVLVLAYTSLYFTWAAMILIFCVVMTLLGIVASVWIAIVGIHFVYVWLREYHVKLKRKKNLY